MLLVTESAAEFAALRAEFRDEIRPQTTIERMYLDDIVNLVWDSLRWRRAKVAILNLAFQDALYEVLVERLHEFEIGQKTVAILEKWFLDAKVRENISDILGRYGLDESAIEAEAFRRCSGELMLIEQMLASTESRRDRALHAIAFYRQYLAQQLRVEATRVMENGGVRRIECKAPSGSQK